MYNPDNIFAKIISKKMESDIVYEDDQLIAIKDKYPVSPVHILVIPKGSYIDYSDFVANATAKEVQHYFITIAKIADLLGLTQSGYRLISNKGAFSGQSVFHFHTHILGCKEMKDL